MNALEGARLQSIGLESGGFETKPDKQPTMEITMRYTSICLALLISVASVEPLFAAEKKTQAQSLTLKKKKILVPGTVGTINETGGVVYLNASDCRLNGGTVVTPGDDRCGSFGATYCRYSDGNAACLTEQ
jgi:hypothetical protein